MMSRWALCGLWAALAVGLAGCASQPKVTVAELPEIAVVRIEPGGADAGPAGCGFLVSPDGYLITTCEAMAGRAACGIVLHDGRVLSADVVEINRGADLAILKAQIPPTADEQKPTLPHFHLRALEIQPPLHVRVVGPDSLRHASFDHWENTGRDMALDTPFVPADRGRPVLGDDGAVLGVMRGPAEAQCQSMAVPIWHVIEMMPKLKE